MKRAALLIALVALGPGAAAARAPARSRPVVVELYTAEGCVSCDKAGAVFDDVAARDGVVAVTLPVDYWDYLGWADTLAQPGFAERQRAYERRLGLRDVYTPQVIVNGAAEASGIDGPAIEALIAKAKRSARRGPTITPGRGARIAVGAGVKPHGGAAVWLLRYDPRAHQVQVKAGDNRGATVAERDVVRQMTRLGAWTGRAQVYRAPPPDQPGLGGLVLVQGDHGGPILAARRLASAPSD